MRLSALWSSPWSTTPTLCLAAVLSVAGCLAPVKPGAPHNAGATGAPGTADISTKLAGNPIFQAAVPDLALADCAFHWDAQSEGFDKGLEQYVRDEFNCMQKTWQTPLSAAKFADLRPVLGFPTAYPYAATCERNAQATPLVCRDGAIYFQIHDSAYRDGAGEMDMYRALTDVGFAFSLWLTIRTAMFESEAIAEQQAGSGPDEANELSRRLLAVQTCFSGMYIGRKADDDAQPENRDFFLGYIDDMKQGADPTDRGAATRPSAQHMLDWFLKGVGTRRISDCNAWAAPPAEVS
ncbi:MAG: hypothetical protein ACRC20_05880 [Segniliparus sp.]|uniref:hypothetical protein n=1 Tax=Segniliparus sp. TaxID=2804064 RepID=UPI003F2C19D9